MGDPPDPGGTPPPEAGSYVTIPTVSNSNESGMDTDGSWTNGRTLKRARSRKICSHCNKRKSRHNSTSQPNVTDCNCSDSDPSFKKPLLKKSTENPTEAVTVNATNNVSIPSRPPPVGRKMYETFDNAPYVVHVVREQSAPNDSTTLHPVAFGKFLKINNISNVVNGSVKRIGRNRISLAFSEFTDANMFMDNPTLAANQLKSFIPTNNVTRIGLVKGVPNEWSEEEIIENVTVPVGCGKILKTRRLNYKVMVEGSPVWKPSQSVVVTFDGQVLPKRIFMCYNALPVELYTFPTIQCYNCCRFGHTKLQCRSKPRCYKCGQGHTGESYNTGDDCMTCCLCSGSHSAISKSCPELNRQKEIKLTMAKSCISYFEACKLHQPVTKSYADVLVSPPTFAPNSINKSISQTSHTASYKKAVVRGPRNSHAPSSHGYDQAAHQELVKDYNMPSSSSNGFALNWQTNEQKQLSLTDIIIALIQTLTQSNINTPNNVAALLIEALTKATPQVPVATGICGGFPRSPNGSPIQNGDPVELSEHTGGALRACSTVSALEMQCPTHPPAPAPEPLRQHCAGTPERAALAHELTALCRCPDVVPLVVAAEHGVAGECRTQAMPFDYRRVAAYYHHAWPDAVQRAFTAAIHAQRRWERTPVDERCHVFERAADLLAGEHRQRVIAAAMLGQAATAVRAELDVRQLVDQIRFDCYFMRELTKSRCVIDGGRTARNQNQYHGLEGFWAAIGPSDSIATAGQLAVTPALMGNGVVWKPSDGAVLACYRVFEALECAGLPPGVVNFVPCERTAFLEAACAHPALAGVSFGGKTCTLNHIWRRVGENVERYARFPRVVGTGSGKNFHVVHSSANLAAAVAGTARAAFEMAGQKSTSCSRVYVAKSAFDRFADMLSNVARSLVVCHPLDYRCFTSALVSAEAYADAAGWKTRAAAAGSAVALLCGGRADDSVGYFVEPTVYAVADARHELLREETRAPLLALHAFPDAEPAYLEWAIAQSPYALTGAIYAQDVSWAREAVGLVRDFAATLCVNERCSELSAGQQSLGGSRKSGNGAKMGSISCLLQYCSERSLRESLQPDVAVTYAYMDEYPPGCRS